MSTPLATRVRLKIKRILRELTDSREEREWRRIWSFVDQVEGFLFEDQARWLFNAARSAPNGSNLVEIGSFKGRSTCCLAFGCYGSKKRVIAVDPFDGGPDLPKTNSLPDFLKNLDRGGLSEYVDPIVGRSAEVAKTWQKPIHLLFIDGSHNYEDVMADFVGFIPHVVPGGIVALHDVNGYWPGVLRAWNETIQHELTEIGYCNELGYGRKPERSSLRRESDEE